MALDDAFMERLKVLSAEAQARRDADAREREERDQSKRAFHARFPRRFSRKVWVTESQWLAGPHRDSLHIWLHVDEKGVPFLVGRGRRSTAWNSNGGFLWEHYVRNKLGGVYYVTIPRVDLSDQQSEEWLDAYKEAYGALLLNESNHYRPGDRDELDRFHAWGKDLGPLYDKTKNETDLGCRVELARKAVEIQHTMGGCKYDLSLHGELIRELGITSGLNEFFIFYLVEGLVELGRLPEAREELARFLRMWPLKATAARVIRLQKIVDRGTVIRRKKRAPEEPRNGPI